MKVEMSEPSMVEKMVEMTVALMAEWWAACLVEQMVALMADLLAVLLAEGWVSKMVEKMVGMRVVQRAEKSDQSTVAMLAGNLAGKMVELKV